MIGFPIVGHQCAYGNEILGMVMSKIFSKNPLTETQSRYRGVLRTLPNIYDDANCSEKRWLFHKKLNLRSLKGSYCGKNTP